MIELREIELAYDGTTVLRDVNLSVDEGELLLIAGRTGSGKSSLLGIIAGLVPRFSGGVLTGDLVLDGASMLDVPPRERADRIGYVGQDPLAGFVADTVEEELAFGMEQLGLDVATMRRRVEETLDLLGIADLRHRDLRSLSGGQQQRVAIGAVLTMHPAVLVLDEPTSALDPTAAEDVLATLTRLVHDLGLSVLLAEHRLERVVPFADRIAIVDRGQVDVGDPASILATAPIAPPIIELGRHLNWNPLPLAVREARRAARGLALSPPPLRPVSGTPSVLWAAETVSLNRGSRQVLNQVSLQLRAGEVTALMGRNGSGKSTLLWTLQGTLRPTSGKVRGQGDIDPASLDAERRHREVGLVPQTATDLLYLESVAAECAAAGIGCAELLDRLAPGIDAERHPRDLSEGQRLALALAIILTPKPPVLLLDEPTRGLDYPAKVQLAAIVRDLSAQGCAIMIATHDVEFVAEAADQAIVLSDGEVVSSGEVRQVLGQSPAFAPQVTKILGEDWLNVAEVRAATRGTQQ